MTPRRELVPERLVEPLGERGSLLFHTRPVRPGDAGLTPRQVEVLALVADGLRNTEIARRLGVAEETVKSLLHKAYRQLGANDRAHAVLLALRAGAIT